MCKICSKCNSEKPETSEHFPKHLTAKGGFGTQCKLCVSEYSKSWRKENRVKLDKDKKEWYQLNKSRIAEKGIRYRQENKADIAERTSRYKKDNTEKVNLLKRQRELIKRGLPHTFTSEQWGEAILHFDNLCAYCGEAKPLTADHFVSVKNNGEFSANNVIPACRNCNSSKRDSDFHEWYPRQKFYSSNRERIILNFLEA